MKSNKLTADAIDYCDLALFTWSIIYRCNLNRKFTENEQHQVA